MFQNICKGAPTKWLGVHIITIRSLSNDSLLTVESFQREGVSIGKKDKPEGVSIGKKGKPPLLKLSSQYSHGMYRLTPGSEAVQDIPEAIYY